MKIQPVIMSGGAGERLWPMSRKARPKQFLKLVTDKTMFQETALRVASSSDAQFLDPVVIAGGKHGALVAEQLGDVDISPAAIILEPIARNTAAVAAVAAAWTAKHEGDALILLMPADHHIADEKAFRDAVHKGAKAAKDGFIVTFGIDPKTPHTGYGYIQSAASLCDSVYAVEAFKEKPTREVAESYLAEGGYYWNAGIFLFSANAMLNELEQHAPDIKSAATSALNAAVMSGAALRLDEDAFGECPANSVDYAVMEKTEKAAIVAPVDVGWTDIGSWSEIQSEENERLTATVDGKNLIIRTDGPFVGAVGVEDLVIVATKNAVLVTHRDAAQDVKTLVEQLKQNNRNDLL